MRMYCIFAKESVKKMNGIRGKMCTQAGHAYLHAYWDAIKHTPNLADLYKDAKHARKITLIVDTVEELREIQDKYKTVCGTSLVTDAAFTVFDEPTTTCLGLGPLRDEDIGEDLKSLKTFT